MLVLALLLTATAGANVTIGRIVLGAILDKSRSICGEDCAFRGVYFALGKGLCRQEELPVPIEASGEFDLELPFTCTGHELPQRLRGRLPVLEEKPQQCEVRGLDSQGRARASPKGSPSAARPVRTCIEMRSRLIDVFPRITDLLGATNDAACTSSQLPVATPAQEGDGKSDELIDGGRITFLGPSKGDSSRPGAELFPENESS